MVTQLTLRGVDKALEQRLKQEAKRRGLSVNRVALDLLRRGAGLVIPDAGQPVRQPGPDGKYHDLDHLAGGWTKEEADAFDRELALMRRIDPEVWIDPPDPERTREATRATLRPPKAMRKSA